MYHFAVVALLGLVTLKVVDLLVEAVPALDRARTIVAMAVGVGTAAVLDYSLFGGYSIAVREAWMGTVATGLVIGSLTGAWAATLGWLGSREAGTTEQESSRRPRIAA